MKCNNHLEVDASGLCLGCTRFYCKDCLVEVEGKPYCTVCKEKGIIKQPVTQKEDSTNCQEANDALMYAIIGIFCFGIILGPIAISKAMKAHEKIDKNPELSGSGTATAAKVIGTAEIIFWVIAMFLQLVFYLSSL